MLKSKRAAFRSPDTVRVRALRSPAAHILIAPLSTEHRLCLNHLRDFPRLCMLFHVRRLWFLRRCRRSLPCNHRWHWKMAGTSLRPHSHRDNRVRWCWPCRPHQSHPFRQQSSNSLFSHLSVVWRFHAFCDGLCCGQFAAVDTQLPILRHYSSLETTPNRLRIASIVCHLFRIGRNPSPWRWLCQSNDSLVRFR